jgi:hypothetical protein
MSEPGTRPGGLTALAIINFVWAVLELASGAAQLAAPALMPIAIQQGEKEVARLEADTRANPEKLTKARADLEKMREGEHVIGEHRLLIVLSGGMAFLLGAMLIVSGIGYLKQRRVLGKFVGTAYAVIELLWQVAAVLYVQNTMGESPGIFSLIGFIYPAITLFMLQVMFKDDFVNP